MPIVDDNPTLIKPKSKQVLVKYLDLIKFISLLNNQALFFCRLDILEDKFEGTTARKNRQLRINSWASSNRPKTFNSPTSKEQIINNVNNYFEFEEKLKSLTLINCWNKSNNESAALWKIYSDNGKGIMIKTTVESLMKSLQYSSEIIRISEVNYIDYEREEMLDGNTMFPIIHKQNAYHYEEEVRLFHEIDSDFNFTYNWSKEKVKEGRNIKVDIDELINEIVIGPFTPIWIIDLIKDICLKYKLNKEISLSKLTLPIESFSD